MEKIVIKPEGAFYAFYDDMQEDWILKDLIESTLPISWYSDMPVEIQGQVSILKIFELFERYAEQIDFLFAKALKTLVMDDIFQVIDKITESEPSTLKATCLVWVGEVVPPTQEEEEPLLKINSALIGLDTDEFENEELDEDVYQLTNFDFIEWVKLPVYLDNYLDFAEFGKTDVIFSGEYYWTLYNLFDTILSEISLNLFVSGIVSSPDVIVNDSPNRFTAGDFFNYLEDLDDINDNI